MIQKRKPMQKFTSTVDKLLEITFSQMLESRIIGEESFSKSDHADELLRP